jgi:hypothetical protein
MTKKILISGFTLALLFNLSSVIFTQKKSKEKKDIREKSIDELIADFTSNNWMDIVSLAKKELEARPDEALPKIIALLDNDKKVTLENTADLIYPGAKTFYGHGYIVDYDVDRISVRAGWLLEELTFQDFGFREGSISEDQLLKAVLSGKRDTSLKDVVGEQKEEQVKKQSRNLALVKAKQWWQNIKTPWKRFDAIVEGLKGNDTALQYRIFQWLRNRETKCDGLTLESFDRFILHEVKRLAKSENENVRREATYLLEDNSNNKWWYRNKLKRDFPDKYATMELK